MLESEKIRFHHLTFKKSFKTIYHEKISKNSIIVTYKTGE